MKSLKTLLVAITSAIVIVVAFGSTLLAYVFARDAALKICRECGFTANVVGEIAPGAKGVHVK